jgi:hypothetical protein
MYQTQTPGSSNVFEGTVEEVVCSPTDDFGLTRKWNPEHIFGAIHGAFCRAEESVNSSTKGS